MLFRHGTVRGQVSLLSILLTERLTKLRKLTKRLTKLTKLKKERIIWNYKKYRNDPRPSERPIMRWNGSIMAPNGRQRKMPWLS